MQTANIFTLSIKDGPGLGQAELLVSVTDPSSGVVYWAEHVMDLGLLDALALGDAALYAWASGGVIGIEAFWESQYPTITPAVPVDAGDGPSGPKYRHMRP